MVWFFPPLFKYFDSRLTVTLLLLEVILGSITVREYKALKRVV